MASQQQRNNFRLNPAANEQLLAIKKKTHNKRQNYFAYLEKPCEVRIRIERVNNNHLMEDYDMCKWLNLLKNGGQ
ncbi:15530_t:CDS:2 [Cetraspora pellucida]|uniref:15530_t:CDS:1 n=1 Tax=Cetraspora pellucida TaxID=1433469 RepID=A0ACA9KEE1_9GLOM|nr:15530_t:CDS:2 [Cetraspora pellucida]